MSSRLNRTADQGAAPSAGPARKPGSDHLQIRSLWAPAPTAPPLAEPARDGQPQWLRPRSPAQQAPASYPQLSYGQKAQRPASEPVYDPRLPVPQRGRALVEVPNRGIDYPIGLRGVRPGMEYTRGVPTPRVAGQQWEDEFRGKLVAAIAERRRRAYVSVGVAGGGVLMLVACFAALLVLRGTDIGADDLMASLVATTTTGTAEAPRPVAVVHGDERGQAPARPFFAAATERAPETVADQSLTAPSRGAPQRGRPAILGANPPDQDLPTTVVPPAAAAPARVVPAARATSSPAPTSAPRMMRTRLRIVGDTVTDPGAMILLRGFPDGISLSDGMSPSPGTWVLGLESARNLQILSPVDYAGTFRASLEVMGPGGVSLLRQDAEIRVPAAALVIVLPTLPALQPPPPARRQPQLQARGGDTPGDTTATAVTDKALGTALATGRPADEPPAEEVAEAPVRRRGPQPAYGLGGPR